MKSKKILALALSVLLAIGMFAIFTVKDNSQNAQALNLDEADLCLVQTIETLIDIQYDTLSYNRNELFDFSLQPFGYEYILKIDSYYGYALMIRRANFYEITEIYSNKKSPYENIEGLPIYLTPLNYIQYYEEQFYDIDSGIELDDNILLTLDERGFGFSGGIPGESVRETITYDSKSVDEWKIPGTFPTYVNGNPALSGTCAVDAGSVVLGYFGRYYPQLMPNFTVGRVLANSYYYYGENDAVQAIINDLYVRMGTGVGGGGTTATGFRYGLQNYVNSKGLNITYTSVVNNTTLNYEAMKNQLNNLKPIALFFNTYNLIHEAGIEIINANTTSFEKRYFGGLHVMIAFGYHRAMYYSGSNNFRTDYFLRVSTGTIEMRFGYIKLYDGAILQEGHAINIY